MAHGIFEFSSSAGPRTHYTGRKPVFTGHGPGGVTGDARTNLNRNYVILLVPLVHRVCCTHRPDVYKLYYQDRSGRIVIIKKGTFLLGYRPFRMPVTRKNTTCQCNKGDTLCI